MKQGGVLSPELFSVYIDELLTRLKHSGYGCMVGHGAFAYADDIALVAPTTHALKAMCDIQFNTAKCRLIKYGEFDYVPFISMERRSSMNDMVFILVIQLARLPIVIW